MSQHSLRSIRRKKLSNQTSYESWRELNYWAGELGNREAARRAGVPEATIRRWLKEQRIPKRGSSLTRARAGIDKLRGWKTRVEPLIEPPSGPPIRAGDQNEVVHWLFAAGVGVPGRSEYAARSVVKGERVAVMHAVPLERVRAKVLDISLSGDTEGAFVRGADYLDAYRGDMTQAGQSLLNAAFINGLAWLLGARNNPPAGVLEDEPPEDASIRSAATTYTNDAYNVWHIFNKAIDYPAGLYYIVYSKVTKPGYPFEVYEVTIWVQINS